MLREILLVSCLLCVLNPVTAKPARREFVLKRLRHAAPDLSLGDGVLGSEGNGALQPVNTDNQEENVLPNDSSEGSPTSTQASDALASSSPPSNTLSTDASATEATAAIETKPPITDAITVATSGDLAAPTQAQPSASIKPCNLLECLLPKCRCAGSDIPGNLSKTNTPQIILLTMDDGVTSVNFQLYKDLLDGVTNFNGCPIKATFFVSGENTNYSLVKMLRENGHEIADHSVSHRFPTTWWVNASFKELESEIVDQMNTIKLEVNVTTQGWRNPFLESTESTFEVLAERGFLYDSSIVTQPGERWWPYTFEYSTPLGCYMTNCPKNFYPGRWEVPLTQWKCNISGQDFGSTISECQLYDDEESVFTMLMTNFNLHYNDNKQPFPIFSDSFWFDNKPSRKSAFIKFINEVRMLSDVYFVTVAQALQWVQSPIGLDNRPFSCDR